MRIAENPIDVDRATYYAHEPSQGGPTMAETTDRWVSARGRRIYCRLHRPLDRAGLPVLVYFHGGGWVMGTVDSHDRSAREYAKTGNVAVVNVDYSLAPEAPFPCALEECFGVVCELARVGSEWNLDPTRIVVGGDSAGGNLALATALMLRDMGGPTIRGVLAVYPICDSDFTRASYSEVRGPDIKLTEQRMRYLWDCYAPRPVDRMHPYAAPLRADLASLPPVLLQLADRDVLRSEGEALNERLVAAGVKVDFKTYTGVLHGFRRSTETMAVARDAMNDAGAWLRRITEA